MLKFTVTQFRLGILISNFVITFLIGYHTVYRAFNRYDDVVDVSTPMKKDPKIYLPSEAAKGSSAAGQPNVMLRLAGKAGPFVPEELKEIAKQLEKPGEKKPDDQLSGLSDSGEPQFKPGPLADTYEYVGGLYYGFEDPENVACLKKITTLAVPGLPAAAGAKRTITNVRRPVVRTRNPGAPGAPPLPQDTDTIYLRVKKKWEIEEGKAVGPLRITPEQFVYAYQEGSTKTTFALKRKWKDVVTVNENGEETIATEKPEPDPNNPDAGKETKSQIYVNGLPDPDKEFDDWLNGLGAAAPKSAPASGSSSAPPAAPAGPKPAATTREQLEQLRDLKKQIQGSGNISEKDRKGLEEIDKIMKGAKVK
ncbi:MAG: hypothetical protein HY717_18700 [Planctomycetes bacterium]|nr:hypothetical protein [Planctomycetota bacterium]